MGKNRSSKILHLKRGTCFRRHAKEYKYTVRICHHGEGHNLGRTSTRLVLRESWSFLRYMGPKKGTPISRVLSVSSATQYSAANRIVGKLKSSAFC